MATKEQLLKKLGLSDELIAKLNSGEEFTFQDHYLDGMDVVEAEDVNEVKVEANTSTLINKLYL